MNHTFQHVLVIALSVLGVVAVLWGTYCCLQRSAQPLKIIFKMVVSVLLILGTIFFIRRIGSPNLMAGSVAVLGAILSAMWTPQLSDWLFSPLTGLYDGGNEEVKKRPFYSIARAKQKRGKYEEAIALVREQLEKFPRDFEGQMLIAEIQAEGQSDLAAAEVTVERLCNQKGHTTNEIICALNAVADWHLKYTQDVEGARMKLERIVELFPGSEFALAATQRIAHLGESHRVIMARHDHRKIEVTEGIQNMGLLSSAQHAKPVEVPPEEQAAECVKHLEEYPLDMDAREKLAAIYVHHYQRLDLATDQLEQMIRTPGQPIKNSIRWLNLLADFQVKLSGDYDLVRQTLERIIAISPDKASANLAQTRINYLKLHLKGQHGTNESKRLGAYDQDIGLKS